MTMVNNNQGVEEKEEPAIKINGIRKEENCWVSYLDNNGRNL